MKKITDKEFKEYLEYKRFMGEEPGAGRISKKPGKLSMDELDQVRAARGNQDFEDLLEEMKRRKKEEDK